MGINSLSYMAVDCSIRSSHLEVYCSIILILCSNLPFGYNSITGEGQVGGYVLDVTIRSVIWYTVEVIEVA